MAHSIPVEWWRGDAAPVETVRASSRVAYACLVAFTVMLVASPQQYFPFIPEQLRLALAFAVGGLGAHGLDVLRGHRVERLPREFYLALGLLACALVSIPVSMWPGGSLEVLTDQYLKALAIFWLVGSVVDSTSRLRGLLWTMTLSSVPIAYTGISTYLAGELTQGRIAVTVTGLSSGLAGNPNLIAIILCLFLPLTVALALTETAAWRRALAWGIVGLGIAGVVVTFSRAGFLALTIEAALFGLVLLRRRNLGKFSMLLLVAVLVGAMLPVGLTSRFATAFGDELDGSAYQRRRDQVIALEYILTHPVIGAGLGSNLIVMQERRETAIWTRIHNVYLVYGVDLGATGLILFVWLVASSYLSARRVERAAAAHSSNIGALASGIRVSLIGFMVWGFFDTGAYYFHFYYISGLAVAAKGIAARELGRAI